jgi:hypothetical protein
LSPNIRIDDDVYGFLQKRAQPFVDSPNAVLRRLLSLDGAAEPRTQGPITLTAPAQADRKRRESVTKSSARRRTRRRSVRVSPGVLLPEGEYVIPLLASLAELGGTAPAREVIKAVGEKLSGTLTVADRESLASGAVRWENRVQFVRLRLVNEGLLERVSPRGTWTLSQEGQARLGERT